MESLAIDGMSAARAPRSRGRAFRLALFVVLAVAVVIGRPASEHVRAAALLGRFSDPAAHPNVTEERLMIDVGGHAIPARLYSPPGDTRRLPGVVLVHGVHRAGIEEPRLVRFARAVSAAGLVVLTPEVTELRDYRVSPRSIETVGAATVALGERVSGHIGLMGMSFGGGIALLTAADPRFADRIRFVVAVGAHDDLSRVSRFFAENEIPEPSGGMRRLHAHEYGPTVLVYAHAEDFFAAPDVEGAREALRLWLKEDRPEARVVAATLSDPARAKVEKLFSGDLGSIHDELVAEIDRLAPDMRAVSPHGRLAGIRASVFLLHGEGDTVIPSTETLWLARDVPPAHLVATLVSPAIVHVELKEPSLVDRWELVHFMSKVIGEAEAR